MNKKKVVIGILLILAGIGWYKAKPKVDEFLKPFGRTPFVLVLRDIYIATVAHSRAGDDIPFELVNEPHEVDWNKIDYSRQLLLDTAITWEVKTNSMWLADKVRMIVPYFQYEGVIENPIYPVSVYLYPYVEDRSFHILGNASSPSGAAILNERFFLDLERRDLRQVYSTLVHELIHLQGGGFSGWVPLGIEGQLESRTQAATIEVLAGMCHYRDEIACRAFWAEIESWARGSLLMRLRMYGYEDWYDKIADLLWRDKEDTMARDKSLRHWMLDEALKSHYYTIINDYQKVPWESLVVEGVCGYRMPTGFVVESLTSTPEHPIYVKALMMFDDTIGMFGKRLVNMICRMPHGTEVH
jgi:hypothetical protein